MKNNLKSGFTLIELLITVALIAILSGIVAMTLVNPQKKARDARRMSDLKQYQTAIEAYANNHSSLYYSTSGTVDPSTICATLGTTNCPSDPTSGQSYSLNSTTTAYVLWSKLESYSPVQYFITCSSGNTGQSVTAPSSSACPI